jgi:uncharacterized protein (DUF433 family)
VAEQDDELIGVTIDRAADLVGVSVRQLARWDSAGLVRPTTHRVVSGRHIRIYGLHDLVEACIVAQLLDLGVPIDQVSRVVKVHRSASVKRPLRELTWSADAGEAFVRDRDDHWWGGRHPRQGVIPNVIDLEWLRATLRRNAVARRTEDVGRIERRPRTHGNRAVLAGTRTPVAAVRTYIDRGVDDDEILEAFPHLTSEDIDAVRRSA